MVRAAAVILALALCGCATPEQIAAMDDAKCTSLGAPPGSEGYATCRLAADYYRRQEQANALARLQQASAIADAQAQAQAAQSAPASPPAGFTKICTYSTIWGPRAITIGSTEICPIFPP